jgi:hypothetical protein
MRRKAIVIIIAAAAVTPTTMSNARHRYPSGTSSSSSAKSLRLAIEDLMQTFGNRYPDGHKYLEKLQSIDEEGFAKLKREALLDNPLVSDQPLLYVARAPDEDGTHRYLERYEAFQESGSALKIVNLVTGQIETLVETAKGIIRNPCIHFDGHRILFSMSRDQEELFNIYEVDLRSPIKKLRQLTRASDVSDVDPIYLPDDSIVFASSRDLKYVPCDLQIVPQLFRMAADGVNIHQITHSTAHENQISLMPDGRILYSRWDYIDRNFADGHGFWVTNPDGTNQALIWGNNTTHPSAGWTARFIPETGQLLCILGTHHGSLGGALAILDPRAAIEGIQSIVHTWPAEVKGRFRQSDDDALEREEDSELRYALDVWPPVVRRLWKTNPNMQLYRHTDALEDVRPWYNTPWPLSEKYFLCVRAAARHETPAIYLVDIFGNEIMLHTDELGCFSPMPLAPRPRPARIPSRRDYGNGEGVFFIQNVYQGTHMQGVEPGVVKAVRVVEAFSKRGLSNEAEWAGLGGQNPGVNWMDFNTKQILGTVPVEQDGSAYFSVPADRFVYFQLLDENDMMVQSMRSGTSVHSGVLMGCVGCHESRLSSGPYANRRSVTLAATRAPSRLQPWYGPVRPFSYMAEIQPVFDNYCVRCHDFGEEGAQKIVLSGDRTTSFNVSYMELWRRGYVGGIGAGPAGHLPARSWGSNTSPLIRHLRKGHKKVRLDPESMNRLITWIDLNGPYYPTSCCAYPDNPPGRSPLGREDLEALGELTGFSFEQMISASRSKGPMITFDRPGLSPCLHSLSSYSGDYCKALALICRGQRRMMERPRADMPGFVPWERDLQTLAHLKKYRIIEANSRRAIRKGSTRQEL